MSYSFMLFTSINGTKFDLTVLGPLRSRFVPEVLCHDTKWPVVHVTENHRECKVRSAADEEKEVPSGLSVLSTPAGRRMPQATAKENVMLRSSTQHTTSTHLRFCRAE